MNKFKRDILEGVRSTVMAVALEEGQDLTDLPDSIADSESGNPFRLAIMDLQMADYFIRKAINRSHSEKGHA